MKVFEALAEAFRREGTIDVFGLMGDANQAWIDAMVTKHDVNMYEVRHEGAGCAMADGWTRQSRKTGVCTTTTGPGISQLTTALIVASRAHSPMVAFCGDQPLSESPWSRDSANQGMDQKLFADAAESGFIRLTSSRFTYEAVQRAFYLAKSQQRPIILSVPDDIQNQDFDEDDEYRTSSHLFTNTPNAPSEASIKRAADLMERSKRPVIIVGQGAMDSGSGPAVQALARRFGALVATTLVSINWLREEEAFHAGVSGLYSTKVALELFSKADCVLGVGASLNMYTTEHGYAYPDASYIQIDHRSQVVMGHGRSADCYLQGDARLGVEALDQELAGRGFSQVGFRTPETKELLEHASSDPREYELEPETVDPRAVCHHLDESLPSDTGVILGGAHQSNIAGMCFTRPRSYTIINKAFGAIGHGLTTSIGAVIASGMRPAVLTEGDAGFMMYLGEFDTAVRYKVPLLVAVLNNQRLASEVERAKIKGMNPELPCIPTPDLGAVGIAMGGRGHLIRTMDELAVASKEFINYPAPTLLDIRISPNVLSIQYRRKFHGDDSV